MYRLHLADPLRTPPIPSLSPIPQVRPHAHQGCARHGQHIRSAAQPLQAGSFSEAVLVLLSRINSGSGGGVGRMYAVAARVYVQCCSDDRREGHIVCSRRRHLRRRDTGENTAVPALSLCYLGCSMGGSLSILRCLSLMGKYFVVHRWSTMGCTAVSHLPRFPQPVWQAIGAYLSRRPGVLQQYQEVGGACLGRHFLGSVRAFASDLQRWALSEALYFSYRFGNKSPIYLELSCSIWF